MDTSTSAIDQRFREARERCTYHLSHAERHCSRNRRLGIFFNLGIPVVSSVLTFLMTSGDDLPTPAPVASGLGLLLTVMTIVNSSLRPGEKFVNLSSVCIRLHDWDYGLQLDWPAKRDEGDAAAIEFLREKDQELSEIGRALAQKSLPKGAGAS